MAETITQRARLTLSTPPEVTYVIGDVHGRLDLYDQLEAKIRDDAAEVARDKPILVVLVGDVIDRGPSSAAMLDRLVEGGRDGLQRISVLGNHEAMFLDFLNTPDGQSRWLGYGGRETLMSYGISVEDGQGGSVSRDRLKLMIDSSVPASHIELLRQMPVSLRVPGYLICHAGVDPARRLSEQEDDDLIWGDPSDLDRAPYTAPAVADMSANRLHVVHGHVPQKAAGTTMRRVAVDTGAYATGLLSAARLRLGHPPLFLTAGTSAERDNASLHLAITKP